MGKYRLENVIPFIKNIKTLIRFKVRKGEHFSNYCKQNLEISFFELARLMNSNKPRMNAMIFKKEITIIDSFWYIHSLREIFYLNTYKFSSTNEEPYIIDCGSNIGLSIIYFKKLFPNSKVLGFEPDPKIYEILKHNLKIFSYTDIILENKAVWNEIATLPFSSTGSIGGNIGRLNEDNVDNIINVETIRLKDFLTQKIDFLKIDIEGAEYLVLKDIEDNLSNVENLFIEYHSSPDCKQTLSEILGILTKSGFRFYIKEAWDNLPIPFEHRLYKPFWDLQLNIFAFRK